jgi:cellulose synthase/poly-beta-1,6-N-acetylglucosamine synthase-like glycosyltransferase
LIAHTLGQTRLDDSINGLRRRWPELSAHQTLSPGQRRLLVAGGMALVLALLWNPTATFVALFSLAMLLYLATLGYRLYLVWAAIHDGNAVSVSDAEARAIPDGELPLYTVLVPAYREATVIQQTIAALETLEYPAERLEIKLLLEADDRDTIAAARSARSRLDVELVLVPPSLPRTKPKACNYGLSLAHGELVTMYDAEDRPEPLQLRRVVAAFRRLPASVACLQARLFYYNVRQNLITRWFAIEYASWFWVMLPALASRGGPMPLGGTSMHIPRRILEAVGGWDSHNVTEDADLGIRLQRLGYRSAVLDSTTLEEANSDFVNWIKQRSRWYKGYLQTWLVHTRHPLRAFRAFGGARFLGLNLILGAIPIVALINPVFWFLTVAWVLLKPHFVEVLLPAPVYDAGLLSMILGNLLALYISLVAIRIVRARGLLLAVLLSPLYWLMMSMAAIRAFLQLLVAPSFWEKSVHGLDRPTQVEVASVQPTIS